MSIFQLLQIIGLIMIGVGFEALTFLAFAIHDDYKHPDSNFLACPKLRNNHL